jgi:trk system potassium uptake protein
VTRTGFLGIRINHPAQLVVAAFAIAITVGTLLLLAPVRHRRGRWSLAAHRGVHLDLGGVRHRPDHRRHRHLLVGYGQGVILLLIQLGGFGIMTLASLAAIFISHRWA